MAAKENNNIASISLTNTNLQPENKDKVQSSDFRNICLEDQAEKPKRLVLKDPKDPEFSNKKGKTPRRVVHFSDGILEEYSETEDEDDEVDNTPKVDPKTLTWFPWLLHYMNLLGSKSLGAADVCGEKLAWFFGITSPKYQYAIDEYYKVKKEEEEEQAREARELELLHERHLKGSHPDEEAVTGAAPEVVFSNQAFTYSEESQPINNREDFKGKVPSSENTQNNLETEKF